jgi:hypothetical protein
MRELVWRALALLSRTVSRNLRQPAAGSPECVLGAASDEVAGAAHHQSIPRLGFLPTYSFPVNSVQLEVLQGQQRGTAAWEQDIQLVRDARLGISEYAPGAQVIANGRIWTSYGVGQYPKEFMKTRFYRECAHCRHVEVAEERFRFRAHVREVFTISQSERGARLHRAAQLRHIVQRTQWA